LRDWILQQRQLKRQVKKEKKAVNGPSEMEPVVIEEVDLDDDEDPAVIEEILRQQVEQVSQVTVQFPQISDLFPIYNR
jgi:stress response protein YsnF